ncbi:response regulator transcription factor [Evansella cellulosilytica]|uniref:Two component transcriptional regulator, LuxR family n=1 Tax=Evansella cellulosilytica (strain ATCC 21833 / DSM 2522 / FERM P-1141 / JCM 9156 / N-4) TaxID=649639 RepID=E6TSQ5_EVAC2|nr:response regulator transcription factor [Evansella cellulosilytica]ADU29563.1 two component transcriptional regulator, LuxR family [Evansella cellulosilytica DSM 2522]
MKILIVDDDPLVCQSLKVLLSREKDMEVIGTAQNGAEAVAFCQKELLDVVLMDIQMPIMDGIQATRQIKLDLPKVRIMMLTTFKDEKNIRMAILAGAEGYLIKSTSVTSMAQQIRALMSGSTVLDADVLKELTEPSNNEELDQLTPREKDIAELVAQGLSNREIAEQLYIGEGTVRNNLSIILEKLDLRDRTQLAIYYWKKVK